MTKETALILVNLGTPGSPTPQGVRRFLRPFLSDRRVVDLPRCVWFPILYGIILPLRSPKVARLYEKIWWPEGSPLEVITRRQVQKLQQQLDGQSFSVKVCYAMAYGEPSLASVAAELIQAGVQRAVVLPLYPQFCSATTGSVCDQLTALRQCQGKSLAWHWIDSYHDQPAYIEALVRSITDYWQQHGKPQKLLLSFHGIPQALVDRGDPYVHHCRETAALVAKRLQLPDTFWQVCFQSRFGRAEWAKPYTDLVIDGLAAEGLKRIDVITPAFASDCLETLEEIAVQTAERFVRAGGETLRLIPCLNDSETHIAMMAELFQKQLSSDLQ